MSMLTPLPPSLPIVPRLIYSLPVVGWIARDVAFGDKDNIWYALVIALTAVVLAVATYGLPALVMIMLSLVPLMFLFFVAISWPWNVEK